MRDGRTFANLLPVCGLVYQNHVVEKRARRDWGEESYFWVRSRNGSTETKELFHHLVELVPQVSLYLLGSLSNNDGGGYKNVT